MDSLKKFVAAAGTSLFLTGGGAIAADMSDLFLEPLLPYEIGSSWYLRGDIGYRFTNTPGVTYTPILSFPLSLYDTGLDDTWLVGFGAGYKFNQWFRSDVTLDYTGKSDFAGSYSCLPLACGLPYSNASAELSAWTVLANAYLDFGTWQGLTPYIGAGVGAANLQLEGYAAYNPPLFPPSQTVIGAKHDTWNFAWALMAGASYDLTSNWLVDVNYRYMSLGDIGTVDQFGGLIDFDTVSGHEIRIGVRYLID